MKKKRSRDDVQRAALRSLINEYGREVVRELDDGRKIYKCNELSIPKAAIESEVLHYSSRTELQRIALQTILQERKWPVVRVLTNNGKKKVIYKCK